MNRHADDIDHDEWCEGVRFECGAWFCPDHDHEQPEQVTPPAESGAATMHKRGMCLPCDLGWADIDANLAYDAALAAGVPILTCHDCHGAGEVGVSQDYWGNWNTEPCRLCRSQGWVTQERVDEWAALVEAGPC